MQVSEDSVQPRVGEILAGAGIVGDGFRKSLTRDLTSSILLRDGMDQVHVTGAAGTGKSLVAGAIHEIATEVLGRRGMRVDLSCAGKTPNLLRAELEDAADAADDGTLVLRGLDELGQDHQAVLTDVLHDGGPLVVSLGSDERAERNVGRSMARIALKPLHERDADVVELMSHFAAAAIDEAGWQGCRGMSRQALADVAEAIRDVQLSSVRKMRELARDLVFGLAAVGHEPLKLTSDHVRPLLEERFGQTEERRQAREELRVESLLGDLGRASLLQELSELHGVPEHVLTKQMEVLREVVDSIDDVPRSYRNIMTRADDVMRTGLWLLSGGETQAAFRRFFGEERFMRPTKSVAWAFYNRVFKRDV